MLPRHSPTSPFMRKVVVLLPDTGLVDRETIDTADDWSEPSVLTVDNALSTAPRLLLDDGVVAACLIGRH